ncbi:hypothetical protein [Streptomyces sp. DSM 118878]
MDDSIRAGHADGMTPKAAAAKRVVDTLGIGALVIDTARQRLGRVMGHYGACVACRPPRGGLEWDVSPEYIRAARPDEILHLPATTRELPS